MPTIKCRKVMYCHFEFIERGLWLIFQLSVINPRNVIARNEAPSTRGQSNFWCGIASFLPMTTSIYVGLLRASQWRQCVDRHVIARNEAIPL